MIPTFFLLFQSQDIVLDKVWSVLITGVVSQIVVGVIFMIGFVAVVRKSIDKDIPTKLASIDHHIEELAKGLLQMRREVDRHEFQIGNLEKRVDKTERDRDDLDDTRSGTPRRPRTPR